MYLHLHISIQLHFEVSQVNWPMELLLTHLDRLSHFADQSSGLRQRRPLAETAARWRCELLIKNLTAHYDSQFCVSFNFDFY